jgi:coenzyme F420-0:L-glutamate ligase/coenzyme F420-1:gamma-L-glutamate ligase
VSGAGPGGGVGVSAAEVSAVGVPGIGEVRAGDDLAALVARACAGAGLTVGDDDVLVIASKVVAKAEGRAVPAADVAARAAAVRSQTVRVVAERLLPDGRTTQVVQSRSGPVMAAAGIDASDVPDGTVLLLPADPDASARALRARFAELTGARPAVVVSDTGGRPWRDGVVDFALGAAGLAVLDDVRGQRDRFGRVLEVTVRAVGDQVASLGDLVKGKAAGTPVALVRGLGAAVTADDGPGAAPLVRVGPGDWFAHGHVEAVRAALGVHPGHVPPRPMVPGPFPERLARAVLVARAGSAPADVEVLFVAEGVESASVTVTGSPFAAGAMAERLRVALWSESLAAEVSAAGTGAVLHVGPLPPDVLPPV